MRFQLGHQNLSFLDARHDCLLPELYLTPVEQGLVNLFLPNSQYRHLYSYPFLLNIRKGFVVQAGVKLPHLLENDSQYLLLRCKVIVFRLASLDLHGPQSQLMEKPLNYLSKWIFYYNGHILPLKNLIKNSWILPVIHLVYCMSIVLIIVVTMFVLTILHILDNEMISANRSVRCVYSLCCLFNFVYMYNDSN